MWDPCWRMIIDDNRRGPGDKNERSGNESRTLGKSYQQISDSWTIVHPTAEVSGTPSEYHERSKMMSSGKFFE
jgi:hypothetical protein